MVKIGIIGSSGFVGKNFIKNYLNKNYFFNLFEHKTKVLKLERSKIFKGDMYCDEKGLIFEAYNLENIESSSCRVIFFDWLISLDQSIDQGEAITELLKVYSSRFPNHPMTELLIEGQKKNLGIRRKRRSKNSKGAIL